VDRRRVDRRRVDRRRVDRRRVDRRRVDRRRVVVVGGLQAARRRADGGLLRVVLLPGAVLRAGTPGADIRRAVLQAAATRVVVARQAALQVVALRAVAIRRHLRAAAIRVALPLADGVRRVALPLADGDLPGDLQAAHLLGVGAAHLRAAMGHRRADTVRLRDRVIQAAIHLDPVVILVLRREAARPTRFRLATR
jgi:hypothetical protein